MKIGDKLYRYESYRFWDYEKTENDWSPMLSIGIGCIKLYVEKITPCGCWAYNNETNERHFILNNAKKKYAYKTKELAIKAFIAKEKKAG